MPDRYWVGGSGNWSDNTNHWSASSGGAPGATKPTAADNVIFDAASAAGNYTVTVNEVGYCLDFTASAPASGNLTLAGSQALLPYGSLTLYAGMVWTHTGSLSFRATSTGKTINTAGTVLGTDVYFEGVGGGWTLAADLTTADSKTIWLMKGALNTNGYALQFGIFSSTGADVRSLTLGSSQIRPRATGTSWNVSSSLTLDAGTSLITFLNGSASPTFNGGGLVYYDLSATSSAGGIAIQGANTFHDLTLAFPGGNRIATINATVTVNGLLTLTGVNANQNRLLVSSSSMGDQRTFNLGTTGTVALTNVDFSAVAFTGTNAPVSGTSLGDAGGNSGIAFTAPVTRYWVGDSGNMSDAAHWSEASGGAGGASVPICHDTMIFDAQSFSGSGAVVTQNTWRWGTLDFSACTNNPTISITNINAAGIKVYGSLVLSPDMTVSSTGTVGTSDGLTLMGRGNHVLNLAGHVLNSRIILTQTAPGGTYTAQGDIVINASRTFTMNYGTFDANGYNVTAGSFNFTGSSTRSLLMGSGTWTATGTGTIWNCTTTIGMTLDAGQSTIKVTDASAPDKTFVGGGITFNNLWFTGAGTGKLIISGNGNVFNDLKVDTAPKTVQLPASGTQTVGSLTLTGSAGNPITLQSSSGSTAYIINRGVYDSPQDVTLTNVTIAVEYQTGEGVLTVSDPAATMQGAARVIVAAPAVTVSDPAASATGAALAELSADAVTVTDPAAVAGGSAIADFLTELLTVSDPAVTVGGAAAVPLAADSVTVSDPALSAVGAAVAPLAAESIIVSDPEVTMQAAAFVLLTVESLTIEDPAVAPSGAALVLLSVDIVTVEDGYVECYPIISGRTFTANERLFVFTANERLFVFTANERLFTFTVKS